MDRDGVINELVWDARDRQFESPYRAADVRLIEGVPAALARLANHGFVLVVVSNQPGAAKRKATRAELAETHQRIVELLADDGVAVDDWRYCLHHPDGDDPELRRDCECRKPKPGMIRDAAADLDLDLERSWLIGDADRDVEAAARAGCRAVLVEYPNSRWRRQGTVDPQIVAADLQQAVAAVIETTGRSVGSDR